MSEERSPPTSHVPTTTTPIMECADNNDDESCPVCLLDNVHFVTGPCRHMVCLPCLERILSSPVRRSHGSEPTVVPDDDAHLDVPTRGRCPVCRSSICLFDLVTVTPNINSEPSLAIRKNHDIVRTDLKGCVYVQDREQVGKQSLHFPSDDDITSEGNHAPLPYIDFSKVEDLKFSNGNALARKKFFEPDCHFHEPTRTFHGRIRWGETCDERVSGSLEWDYAFTFSYDYQFVSRGVLTKKRSKCHDPNCPRLDCKFPLDGQWSGLWPYDSTGGESRRRTLDVHNNTFLVMQYAWQIHYEDNKIPVVDPSHNRFISHHNLAKDDVKVGESIEFSMLSTDSELPKHMIWTRETNTSEHEYLEVLNFGSRQSQHFYYLQSGDCSSNRLPEYHEDSVWGNTFCQGLAVGLASYHFLEDSGHGAYISYEHEMTSMWPPLDNGNPIPAKMWFTEITFEPETHTFYGKIDWERKFGTTWQGSRWWRYKIEFDNYYSCITGGYVMSVMSGLDDEREMSRFGVELLYINAGLVVQCHESGDFQLLERTIQSLERRVWQNVTSGEPFFLSRLLFTCRAARRESGKVRFPRSFQI